MKKISVLIVLILMSIKILHSQTTMTIWPWQPPQPQYPISAIDSITFSSVSVTIGPGVNFDGYTYSTIILGNGQEWMSENLKTSRFANGDPITEATSNTDWQTLAPLNLPVYAHTLYDSSYNNVYGSKYNWYAVSDSRNVCPSGWHVPSLEEYWSLCCYFNKVGEGIDPNGIDIYIGNADYLMSNQYWYDIVLNQVGCYRNISRFNVLPASKIEQNGTTYLVEGTAATGAYFWTSSTSSMWNNPISIHITIYHGGVEKVLSDSPSKGFSVRCLKD